MTSGKLDHEREIEARMKAKLAGQPDYIRGFYNSMIGSSRTKSVMTRQNYTYSVIKFMEAVGKPCDSITYDDIIEYRNSISRKENGEAKSGSYMCAVHGALVRFFKYLVDSGRITSNPMARIERPAPKPSDQVVRVSLTKKEFKSCVDNIRKRTDNYKLRDELMFALFISTAMRCTALSEINISDIDIQNATLKVIDKGNRFREFDLSPDIMNLLQRWLEVREKLMFGYTPTDALFISNRRKRISQGEIRNITMLGCKKTGKHITPHKFRRSCATWIVSDGGTVFQAQQMLGHKNPKTTTEIYLQNKTEEFKKATQIASNFYKS